MDEVVVTGYFTKSKSSYTGAVKPMKANELKAVSGTNIIAAISALTPGLNLVERSDLGSNPNHVPELLCKGKLWFCHLLLQEQLQTLPWTVPLFRRERLLKLFSSFLFPP